VNMDPNVTYRTASPRASSGVGIVILLYEQLVQDFRRAMTAIDEEDVEDRTFELGHALEVVGQLQSRLDMELGGDVAHNLDRFYGTLRAGIVDAQVNASKPRLQQLIDSVLSIREAWLHVEQVTLSRTEPAETAPASDRQGQEPLPETIPRNWRV
jgi:flagellar protein FliS